MSEGPSAAGVDLRRVRCFRLVAESPTGVVELEHVASLRFGSGDGHRGVLRGHEPSCAVLRKGVVRIIQRVDGKLEELFLATEGGLAWIERAEVRLVTRWATGPADLPELRRRLEAHVLELKQAEEDARTVVARHEVATQRALARLRREVDR